MDREQVVLVDSRDAPMGIMEKLEAHQRGLLHRAFSIFVFNSKGQLLLQQRAKQKYHSANLWANTCCSHPRPEEPVKDAAHRRLKEELGFDCALEEKFSFIYKSKLNNDLIEHEYDHVLFGYYDGTVKANNAEVQSWKYLSLEQIREEVTRQPEAFAAWFKLMLEKIIHYKHFIEHR